jgi:hypothetical protein
LTTPHPPRLSGRTRGSKSDLGAPSRVRSIFKRFVQLKSATLLATELVAAGATNRYGNLLDKGVLYKPLNNRVYIGEAVHKGVSYPGEHKAIIDRNLWDQAHGILRQSPRKRAAGTRAQTPALLKGPAVRTWRHRDVPNAHPHPLFCHPSKLLNSPGCGIFFRHSEGILGTCRLFFTC